MTQVLNSYGKINMSLDITGVRSDGYHLISSVMREIELCDTVSVSAEDNGTDKNVILLSCTLPFIPCGEKNTAYKAAKLFLETVGARGKTVTIQVDKRLPVAGGLGGSSTNAAAVIKALNSLLNCGFDSDKLREIAVKVGADVPFFIDGGCAVAEGIGEIITPLETDFSCVLLIAKCGRGANSKNIYADFDKMGKKRDSTTSIMKEALRKNENVEDSLGNMLTPVTAATVKSVPRLIKIMLKNGALGAEMSGSGAGVYGIYKTVADAEKGYGAVKRAYKNAEVFITKTKD